MKLAAKLLRAQLELLRPFVQTSPLEFSRAGQDKLGRLMLTVKRRSIVVQDKPFEKFEAAWILPRDEVRSGVIMYLHGGGYTCGSLDYSKGFASFLSSLCGMRVLCVAYRLAPENPYPAALEDVLEAYRFLTGSGYDPKQIILCGESAGGGLIYSLCLKLKELGISLPAGIIALSPWTDLTLSGKTYKTNKKVDPSMLEERLAFFADCYTGRRSDLVKSANNKEGAAESAITEKNNPFVSPIFGDLFGMPPSLIFAGGDEIMLDDAAEMHERLIAYGAQSHLVVKPHMWHAYLLYGLEENESDFDLINDFISSVFPDGSERKLRWMKLDNAAKIYPAAATRRWSNVFRLSATLKEDIDRDILQSALDVTVRRFPSIAVRLRRGLFWYYLEEIPRAPRVQDEKSYPLHRMPFDDIRKCAFRVLVYKKRVAVEFFHAVTDGNGGLVFLKTLLAEYLTEKCHVQIPNTHGILDRLEQPSEEELEDCFPKYSSKIRKGRGDQNSFRPSGTPETDGFQHITTFMLNLNQVSAAAKSRKVTITAFLTAAMIDAGIRIQAEKRLPHMWLKPVRVLIPVNLRKMFPSKTLRNFVFYTICGVDPRLGEYSFDEICTSVHHQMGLDITPKSMASRIATNVRDEQLMALKIMPLFIKNIVMKAVFGLVGERKSMLSLSNLGPVQVPERMKDMIERFDFVLGVQSSAPYNCGVLSYGDTLYFNIISNINEPMLERRFYEVLREQNIAVKVESNQR
jgi:acetyl esterase/lipase/NRPS condensation-like uncharacterized protein